MMFRSDIFLFFTALLFIVSCEPFETYLYDMHLDVNDASDDNDEDSFVESENEISDEDSSGDFTTFSIEDIPVWSVSLIVSTPDDENADTNDDMGFKLNKKAKTYYLDSPVNDFERGLTTEYYISPSSLNVFKVSDINYLYMEKDSDGFVQKTGNYEFGTVSLKINDIEIFSKTCENDCWLSNSYGLSKTFELSSFSALKGSVLPHKIENSKLRDLFLFHLSSFFANELSSSDEVNFTDFSWGSKYDNELKYINKYSFSLSLSLEKETLYVTSTAYLAEIVFSMECSNGKIKFKTENITIKPENDTLYSELNIVLNKEILASYNNLVDLGYINFNCNDSYLNSNGDLYLGWKKVN